DEAHHEIPDVARHRAADRRADENDAGEQDRSAPPDAVAEPTQGKSSSRTCPPCNSVEYDCAVGNVNRLLRWNSRAAWAHTMAGRRGINGWISRALYSGL